MLKLMQQHSITLYIRAGRTSLLTAFLSAVMSYEVPFCKRLMVFDRTVRHTFIHPGTRKSLTTPTTLPPLFFYHQPLPKSLEAPARIHTHDYRSQSGWQNNKNTLKNVILILSLHGNVLSFIFSVEWSDVIRGKRLFTALFHSKQISLFQNNIKHLQPQE